MLMKLSQVGSLIRARAASRRGQNTVEYLLMLTVIVALVLAVGAFLKTKMPGVFELILGKITGAAGGM
jgi:Flp pilus assembly pilin Flp